MQNKLMAMSGVIEEAFIWVVANRVKTRGIPHSAFARAIWPDVPKATAIGRWRDMRKYAYRTGKRMTVSIENAVRMAAYFNEDICYLLVLAQEYAQQNKLAAGEGE